MLVQLHSPGRFLAIGSILSLTFITFLLFRTSASDHVIQYVLKTPASKCRSQTSPPTSVSPTERNGSWDFVVGRDGDNYGLSEEQCRIAFPKLFVEIEKSVELRKDRPITFKELNSKKVGEGMVRAVVDKGELYVLDFDYNPVTYSRGRATLSSLYRALTAVPNRHELPSIEFIFTTEDFAPEWPGPIWSYSKHDEDESVWLMPDFGYWSWPEVQVGPYREIRRRIAAVDDGANVNGEYSPGLNFHDKKKQLLWRGSISTEPELRGRLLKMTRNKSWASIRPIDWYDEEDARYDILSMEDHCYSMFLMHTEGRSFSGRGKYLQNCRSVFISHRLIWREAHHGALVSSGPEANYVEVERDFSDLEQKIEYLIDNPQVAERIAKNGVETFRDRYLTPAAEACYWRSLIKQYASVCDFEPTLYADAKGKKSRGVPFESWLLTGFDRD